MQLFAPFTVGLNSKKLALNKNIASAEDSVQIGVDPTEDGKSVNINGLFNLTSTTFIPTKAFYYISASSNVTEANQVGFNDILNIGVTEVVTNGIKTSTYKFGKQWSEYSDGSTSTVGKGFEKGKTYYAQIIVNGTKADKSIIRVGTSEIKSFVAGIPDQTLVGSTDGVTAGPPQKPKENPGGLPACSMNPLWDGGGTFMGCIAQGVYYLFFTTTSFIFGLAGKILDFTFMYSISDTSYRSEFVTSGWGIMRDFCNMFFIFVLLYIAFGTILNLSGVKTKEMIINVVIIGLLINFSLFTTQVVIDASNILARVFYNQKTIITGTIQKDAKGNPLPVTSELGAFGEIKLSEAIVSKVDPQELLIRSAEISRIPPRAGLDTGDTDKVGEISISSFILVVFLSTAVNVVGIIAFASSAFIFISRVLGLWLAMIFAPLAFFSYIVPSLQDIKMVGWKKWWPDLIKMAFLAPVFAFFMYLIVGFMSKGLGVMSAELAKAQGGLNFVIAIVVPFAFIMVLLMKAKSVAVDMSGTIGQSITNGIAAVGGVALGGAALGAAALGRSTIGSFMKGASTGDTAAQRLQNERTSGIRDQHLNTFQRLKGNLATVTGVHAAQQAVGVRLNANQAAIGGAAHARHQLDTAAGVVAPGKKWGELNGQERGLARTNLERADVMRNTPGVGNLTYAQLSTALRTTVDTAVAANMATNTTVADRILIPQARRKVGLGEDLIQSAVGGSFDVRNLSKLIAGEQDRGLNKFATGLTSILASGMRGTLKQANINYGAGQKDFIKDLGHTITEALKSTTIKVDLSHVGEEKKEDRGAHH